VKNFFRHNKYLHILFQVFFNLPAKIHLTVISTILRIHLYDEVKIDGFLVPQQADRGSIFYISIFTNNKLTEPKNMLKPFKTG